MLSTSERYDRRAASATADVPELEEPWRWTDDLGEEVEMRSVQPGETIELLHFLRPAPMRPASGSLRPLRRYVESGSDQSVAIVAHQLGMEGRGAAVAVGVLRPVGGERSVAELQLFVVPRRRHRGLGSGIFLRLVQLAKARGVRRLRLRLSATETETLGLLTRMSTHPTVWEDDDGIVVEFPTAAV